MSTIGAYEAKTHFAELLDRVERGEEIAISRRGKVVARIVPTETSRGAEQAQAAFARMRERALQLGIRFDWDEWKGYRDEGRR